MVIKRIYDGFTNPDKVYQDYQSSRVRMYSAEPTTEPTMAEPLVDKIWHQMTSSQARLEAQKREAEKLKMQYEMQKAQALGAQQQANPLYGIQAGTGINQGVYSGNYTITNYPNGLAGQHLVNQWPPQTPVWPPVGTHYPAGLATIWADMRTQAANGNWEKVLVYINWISQLTSNFGNGQLGDVGKPEKTSHDPIFSLSELEQAQDLVDSIEGDRHERV